MQNSTRIGAKTNSDQNMEESTQPACPKCGRKNVMGMVSAFWVTLGNDGEPLEPLHELVESCAELTDCRACEDCEYTWRDGAE